ncbi:MULTISPECIES: branched-chain amino acid aminotransferase [Acidiphilium]|jgi:branched-chain amino acid aminotransferase|uniref:Branched-chain-amino-acid aminotransferase n=2 Tax=Acidiphilium TaxID=522 RepID=A5FWT7_ACICJ|nr:MULTISPECIES: branched-chain amino acid aminotransferase [Acidiphilium]MBU6357820.1 branched-chain amino acid aminotransferase [Rhodospirillales bacterium]ABQ30069.1 branched chain amino acid aminotransferase apoenzyme [Acidiphilium cryptum JF-5]EGO95500.1 Branched-chain amino acid aminotransferase [Acidiphilium sp. PM]KDM67373.1 putative branched-chain-amino-acid aminotransferase IlvE [Acidiphilium sp. JA12-A1]MBS3024619.1 branched-chain amino acid aminotransferase [Acidiphilium multivorum
MSLIPFDDRDGMIWWDGELRPWRDAKLHVLTHGLHYASAVFEGERSYGGNIFRLRDHTNRLIQSGKLLGFDIPFSADAIDAACNEVLKANGLTDAYIRPIAWRGSEMLAVSAQQTKIHLAIAAWPWPNLFGNDRMKGITLGMAPWRRPDPRTAPTASKAAGLYMIGTLSKHAAEAEGFNDALMLTLDGHVAEATGANIFFAIDGELHTPTPDCFLDGITRRTVMALARARQIPVHERHIKPEEMAKASEVFLAGTAAEVTPVRQIGELTFTPGKITETLIADYTALVHMSPEEVAKRAA